MPYIADKILLQQEKEAKTCADCGKERKLHYFNGKMLCRKCARVKD